MLSLPLTRGPKGTTVCPRVQPMQQRLGSRGHQRQGQRSERMSGGRKASSSWCPGVIREGVMRQGFRVIDTDTHVNPTLDVLLRYADQALQERMDELKPYMRTVKPRPGQGDAESQDTATMLTIRPL